MIDDAATKIAVLQAANTSLGVNLLTHLVRATAARLGEERDLQIVEMHHRHKKDAPTVTALHLGWAAAERPGIDPGAPTSRYRDAQGSHQAGPLRHGALPLGALEHP